MKWFWALACVAILCGSAAAATSKGAPPASSPTRPARSGSVRLPTVQMYGHEFVDLAAWARASSLQLQWDRKSKDLLLSNRWSRLRGMVSSRQLEVNGVKVWLSIPITQRDQSLYLSTLDLRTLLDPLLKPTRNQPGQRIRTVALDPGHGGKDPGNQANDRQEKVHTLLLAKKLKTLLEQAGLRVILTRSTDTYVDLDLRPQIAKRARADLFVSLHYNNTGNGRTEPKGIETYCVTPAGVPSTNADPDEPGSTKAVVGNLQNHKSVLLAYQIHKALVTSLPAEDRGLRRARFAVLRNAEMPAVLVEAGFLSSPEEARRIASLEYRNDLARALTDGILAYKRLLERK